MEGGYPQAREPGPPRQAANVGRRQAWCEPGNIHTSPNSPNRYTQPTHPKESKSQPPPPKPVRPRDGQQPWLWQAGGLGPCMPAFSLAGTAHSFPLFQKGQAGDT